MKRLCRKQTLAAGAMAAILLAMGAAAATRAGNQPANIIPVTYRVREAPSVTPAEAERAVTSAKSLSTAFRVASEQVLPAVVTIENMPRTVVADDKAATPLWASVQAVTS